MAFILAKKVWQKQDTDCSTCTGCQTMIASAKYVLCVELQVGSKSETIETKMVLCESCYEALKTR